MNLVEYLGIPHVKGGRDIQSGLDCWGLVVYFYKNEFGINLPTYDYINTKNNSIEDSSKELCITNSYLNFNRVVFSKETRDFNNVKYGDIALFNIAGNPIHTGVILNKDGTMLHSHNSGSVIERITNPQWINRLRSIHRHNQMV